MHSAVIWLFAGTAFFMFGMSLASDYLQRLMSNRVRELMSRLSDRPYIAISVGILLTVLLQSSGAVTSMLVGLGSAGVISLPQVMGVIIGSAIGSTVTVQLISFDIAQYGLPIFVVSFTAYFTAKKRPLRYIAGILVGFGLIFYGIEMMGRATAEFKTWPAMVQVFEYLSREHLVALLVTAVFTGFVHSSAVTIGFAITLCQSGLMTMEDSMWWIYGANIGTTATALMASVGGNYVGRQVAWAHFFYKAGSVLIFIPFTVAFGEWVSHVEIPVSRDIANAHTIFNVISTLVFYPFINSGAVFMEKLFQPTKQERAFSTKFLGSGPIETPALAYAQATREALRLSDIVVSMLRDTMRLFSSDNPDLVADVHERDNRVDLLFREIKTYLVPFTDRAGAFSGQIFELISLVTDLESAADIIDKHIVELATKKSELKLEFSPKGWEELMEMHKVAMTIAEYSVSCYQVMDLNTAEKIIEQKRRMKEMERQYRESHLERLNKGLKETINTSSIHLELMSDLRRVAGLFANYSYFICRTAAPRSDGKTEKSASKARRRKS